MIGNEQSLHCGHLLEVEFMPKNDNVRHPKHYATHPSKVEVIEFTAPMGFCLGNSAKYVARFDKKGKPLEDLQKALWYLRYWHKHHKKAVASISKMVKYAKAEPNALVGELIVCLTYLDASDSCDQKTSDRHFKRALKLLNELIKRNSK